MYARFALLSVVLPHRLVVGQDDEFEYFRCDACSATFFKLNKTLVERHGRRPSIPSFEFIDVLEDVCETAFTKNEFGVKQHEGKKYLFGPGVTDHIPDKGFGQMGMGDYDRRLSSYCRMFIENVGEEELQSMFLRDRMINRTDLCLIECSSTASGTGALSLEKPRPKKTKKQLPSPSPPPPVLSSHPAPASSAEVLPPVQQPPATKKQHEPPMKRRPSNHTEAFLERAIGLLRDLNASQLRRLGEAVVVELAGRAAGALQPELVQKGMGDRPEL